MGRAASQDLKSRRETALKEKLVLRACYLIEIYQQWLSSGSPTQGPIPQAYGWRTAAKQVQRDYYAEKKKWVAISHSTVRNRYKKLTKSRTDAMYDTTYLSRAQEEQLVVFAREVADRGFPLTHTLLREIAIEILHAEGVSIDVLGVKWTHRFIQRNFEKLKTYTSNPLESVRGRAVNPFNLSRYFDLLQKLYDDYGFKEWNVYGTDESGLMSGVAQRETVIGGVGKKTQHMIREVNRENTTVIATICADGTALSPIVIFKGKHYQMKWLQDNPLDAS